MNSSKVGTTKNSNLQPFLLINRGQVTLDIERTSQVMRRCIQKVQHRVLVHEGMWTEETAISRIALGQMRFSTIDLCE